MASYAVLKPNSVYAHLFPDGRIPLEFPQMVSLNLPGGPLCHIVDGPSLTDEQVEGLADLLMIKGRGDVPKKQEAIKQIRAHGLPLSVDHFEGIVFDDWNELFEIPRRKPPQ